MRISSQLNKLEIATLISFSVYPSFYMQQRNRRRDIHLLFYKFKFFKRIGECESCMQEKECR